MFVVGAHFQGNTEHNQNNKCGITSMRRTAHHTTHERSSFIFKHNLLLRDILHGIVLRAQNTHRTQAPHMRFSFACFARHSPSTLSIYKYY